ncbi:hypothetical protein BH09ACT12_BH09ACT12_17530 [soil metagenome]
MPQQNVVHDPQVLRAISHPVRNRILSELEAQGSLRAADIARELDIPANQASFHLRSLAKYGLVVEDAEAARDKRDRVWKRAHEGGLTINLEDFDATPAGAAAARVFRRTSADWAHVVVEAAYGGERGPDEHRSVTDTSLRLTLEEARELTAALREVVVAMAERTRGVTGEGRRTYEYLGMLLPQPDRLRAAVQAAATSDGEDEA